MVPRLATLTDLDIIRAVCQHQLNFLYRYVAVTDFLLQKLSVLYWLFKHVNRKLNFCQCN